VGRIPPLGLTIGSFLASDVTNCEYVSILSSKFKPDAYGKIGHHSLRTKGFKPLEFQLTIINLINLIDTQKKWRERYFVFSLPSPPDNDEHDLSTPTRQTIFGEESIQDLVNENASW
jgi:hypothetical protein